MTEGQINLLKEYVETVMKKPLESTSPTFFSGDKSAEMLWPLNDRFKKNIQQISSIAYSSSFEKEADEAIKAEVLFGRDWESVSPEAWRVLLERQTQALLVCMLNKDNDRFMPIPTGFPAKSRMGFAMIYTMYEMNLPFPVQDAPRLELPAEIRYPSKNLQ